MVDIAFSSTAPRLGGTTEADDWQATTVPATRVVRLPLEALYAPDFAAYGGADIKRYDQEVDVVLTGNTTGVVLESLTPKLAFDGNHARQTDDAGGRGLPYRVRGPYGHRDYTVDMVGVKNNYESRSLIAPKPGTPLAICNDLVRSRIVGKTPGAASQDVWSSATYTGAHAATPNPSNVFADLMPELSCVTFSSSRHGRIFPAVLVGPRVATVASHVGHVTGDTLTWRRVDGTFQTATIAEHHDITVDGRPLLDMRVLLLSAPVTGVTFGRCLPADAFDYFPGLDASNGAGWAGGRYNGECAVIGWMYNAGRNPGTAEGTNIINTSSPHLRLSRMRWLHSSVWVESLPAEYNLQTRIYDDVREDDPIRSWSMLAYSGDSSGPYFMLTPGGLALLCHLFGAEGGPSVMRYAPAIAAKAIERGFAPAGWSIGTVPMTGLTKPT